MKAFKRWLLGSLLLSFFFCACKKDSDGALSPTPPPGYYDNVTTGIVYNANLIIAGTFSTIFGSAKNIAQWNGSSWTGLASGVSTIYGGSGINTMTVYNGDLIVGGYIDNAGGQPVYRIASWNGSTWQNMDGGVTGVTGGANGVPYVNALAVYNGKLIVAGNFQFAGGIRSNNIALWNDTVWQSIDGGTGFGAFYNSNVVTLAVYNGNLIAAGRFDSIGGQYIPIMAQWNGTSWSSIGGACSPNSGVDVLTVYNGNLIAIGDFTIGGNTYYIAQWNGTTWTSLNSVVSNVSAFDAPYSNYPVVYNGNLYFDEGPNDSIVSRWSGNGISAIIGTGTNSKDTRINQANGTLETYMHPLCVYNGSIIVGGWFTSVDGTGCNNNLAQWNGSKWSSF